MNNEQSLSHTKWECKYHLTWIPKYRKKELYGDLRRYLGEVFRDLAQRRKCEILEGHLMADHAHMLISISPKYAVSQVVGFIKGKSASKHKRIQQFFRLFPIDYEIIARFVVQLLEIKDGPWVLTMDRTNWKFGKIFNAGISLSGK